MPFTYKGFRMQARLVGGLDDYIPTHVYGRYGENSTDIDVTNFSATGDLLLVTRDDFMSINGTGGGVRVPILSTAVENSGSDYTENQLIYTFTISRPTDVGVNFTDDSYFAYLGLAVATDTNSIYDSLVSVYTIPVASRFGIASGGNIQLDYGLTFEAPEE